MTTEQREPAEKLWELEIVTYNDGDILLTQGLCWNCQEDVPIRLHRAHMPLLAAHAGWMTADDYQRAVARYCDRLELLAAMVRAYCSHGHPLLAACDEIVGRKASGGAAPAAESAAMPRQGDLLLSPGEAF